MSTTSSQPQHVHKRGRGVCRRLTAAALCALSCFGDFSFLRHSASAQDPSLQGPAAGAAAEQPAENQNRKGTSKPPVRDLDTALNQKGTLSLREGTLADWLLAIQKTWNVDIIYDSDELQRVTWTGTLTDTTLKRILDTILPGKNYGYRREGNAILIVPKQELGEKLPNQESELIQMEFNDPTEVAMTLKYLLSAHGKAQPIQSSKSLLVIDYPDNITGVKAYVQKLEDLARRSVEQSRAAERRRQPDQGGTDTTSDPTLVQPVEQTITTVLWPKFVLANSISEAITNQMADGTVQVVEELNALVVTGSESAVKTATQVLKQLDVVQKQVRISVLMYDIRIDALEQLGVNWRNAGKARISANGIPSTLADLNSGLASAPSTTATTTTGGTTTTPGTPVTVPPGSYITSANPVLLGSALTLQHLSRYFDISAVILALEETDGARLLARPNVLTYDRRESVIKIISEIPVQQLTQTEMGGNIGTTTFREAGVTLKVTPWIGENDDILLNIAPEFSVLTGFQNGQPVIDRRTLSQTVAIHSGDTLVLGGLRRRNELETVSGIPGLRNLKYFGNIFGAHRTTVEESELVTFIHTEIVDSACGGLLREQVAAQIVNETLDRIPVAGHSPYIESCKDPYCPIHSPRPKYHPGSMLAPDSYPVDGHHHPNYETLPPTQGQPISPAPTEATQESPATPAPATSAPAKSEPSKEPKADEVPPVKVDETARRPADNRMAIRRLPSLDQQVRPQRLPAIFDSAPTRIADKPTAPANPPPPRATQQPPFIGWQQTLR